MAWVFLIGVVLTTVVLVLRMFQIGLANSSFFGQAPAHPIDPSHDPTHIVTAVILTMAVLILAAMTLFEIVHKRFPAAGVTMFILALGPLILNWYVLLSMDSGSA